MRATDRNRYELIKKIEEKLDRGETTEKATGRPIQLPEEDARIPLEPGDEFWLWLEDELAAAIPPDGTFPIPTEETHVLNRVGIRHPENQWYVRETLRFMWAGRAEGLTAEIGDKTPPRK